MMEPPYTFRGNGHWQQSLDRIAFIGQKENFERVKPRIFIPTAGPILQKSIIQNDTCNPTFTAVQLPIAKIHWPNVIHEQIKS